MTHSHDKALKKVIGRGLGKMKTEDYRKIGSPKIKREVHHKGDDKLVSYREFKPKQN